MWPCRTGVTVGEPWLHSLPAPPLGTCGFSSLTWKAVVSTHATGSL